MKVTVQNGVTHGLSRREVEAIVQVFPAAWFRLVKSIVLYQGEGNIDVTFHLKEQIVGLYWPSLSVGLSKTEAIDALLVALAVVAERGELPARISPSLRSRLLEETSEVHQKCLAIVVENAA
jgi:hypothetical protein